MRKYAEICGPHNSPPPAPDVAVQTRITAGQGCGWIDGLAQLLATEILLKQLRTGGIYLTLIHNISKPKKQCDAFSSQTLNQRTDAI